MTHCGLLLAAGSSRRFGTGDKLLALLGGRPLITYATDAICGARLDRRVAVISNPELRPWLTGFEIVEIAAATQSDSLLAGLAAAGECDRLLVSLADMPLVTAPLLERVLHTATDDCPAASVDNGPPMPPACFPRGWLGRLRSVREDRGAGRLLRELPPEAQVAAPGVLADIDTIAQLDQLENRLSSQD